MITNPKDYNIYHKLIENFSSEGMKVFANDNLLLQEIENLTETNNQFFYIGDLINISILYTSKRSVQMLGIDPTILDFYHFFDLTHSDDRYRLSLGRAQILKMAHQIFVAQKGTALMSTSIRMLNPQGKYSNILMQLYLFYGTIPHKSVYLLKVHTNIDSFGNLKHGFHFYFGSNSSNFRYPDEKLLKMSNPFSSREFEIIKLIESGLSSDQIAEKLFLSVHTINTHRRNILKRGGMANMQELIHDLHDRGVL